MGNNVKVSSSKVQTRCHRRLSGDVYKFIQLLDTPETLEAQAGKILRVNSQETGIEFLNIDGLELGFLNDKTVYQCTPDTDILDVVHISAPGTVTIATKESQNTLPLAGFVVSKPTTTQCIIQTIGYLDGFAGLIPGDTYFLGTDGKITNVATTVSGEALAVVGIAKSSVRLELRIGSNFIIRG